VRTADENSRPKLRTKFSQFFVNKIDLLKRAVAKESRKLLHWPVSLPKNAYRTALAPVTTQEINKISRYCSYTFKVWSDN